MRSIILFSLIYVLFPVFAMGQHLADVLVSLQDRQRAVEQRIQLYAYHTPNGVVGDQQLIGWTGLGTTRYPTAANVDALDLGAKVALLNQAVADFGRLAPYYLNLRADDMTTGGIGILRPYLPEDFEDLGRAGAGNYNQVITALAMQVRRLRVLTWTASLKTATERYGIDKKSTQIQDSDGIWGAWVDWHDESLEPGDSEDWMPTSIGEGGKHVATQDSIYKIHWNWFNFRWEESFHVTGQYTATSHTKRLELTRTRTFPIEARLHSKVPERIDQLSGKVALLRRVRWSPVPFTTFAADDDSWNPVNGQWQLVAIEENATGLTNLGPKDEVGVSLSWSELAGGLQNASPTGLQAAWAGSNHLSRIYAAVCMPEFANGVDAPGVASYLAKSGRVSGAPGGDGRPLVHPLPGLMAGIPLGCGLEGYGSGWIGISPTNLAFADQRYVGEGGTVEYDSWISAARFMRFDYMSNLRFTGSAEDFHVVYEAYRDMQSRGAGLPSAQPTTTEQQQSGWNAFISISSHGGRDFFLAWDLPRIRQIVGRDLIADVEMQGHYKCVVKIYRRVVDPGAGPLDRTPGSLADVSEENLIRTVVIESPGVGGNPYPLSPEKTRFTDGTHVIEVWREGFDGLYSAQNLYFKEMDGENELYLKSIVFNSTTSTVTEKLDGNPWKTRTIPGWTGYPSVYYYPDGFRNGMPNSPPRLDTFHDYPGKEVNVWWNSNPPGSETITAAGENIGVSYTRSQSSAGTQFGKFPQALTITRPDRPNETFGWDGSGILTSHEKGLWKSTATVAGNILSGTTQFNESAIGRDWTEFIDSGRSVKSYSAPDGTVTSMTAPAVDSSELEYGSATGTGLPGLPHILTRKDGSGTTWAWTVNGDGSTGLETCDGLLANGVVTRGTKTISTTNARGYVTDTASFLVQGATVLKTGGSSTPEGKFTVWGAPVKSCDFTTALESAWAFDNNFSRLESTASPLGLVTTLSGYDALGRTETVSCNGIIAGHTYSAVIIDNKTTFKTTTNISGAATGSIANSSDALGRLTSSNTTWNGLTDNLGLSHGAANLGITRTHGLLGTHQSSIRQNDGSLASSTGPTLAFGGTTGDALIEAGGMLKSKHQLGNLAARFQTTLTDAWGRIREINTPPASGSGASVATGTSYSLPDQSLKRVITSEPSGRVLITETDPFNTSGMIRRSGIDVNGNGSLGAADRYVESVTTINNGKVVTTLYLTENSGLREILRTEWNPVGGVTATKINRFGVTNNYEETITRTPHFDTTPKTVVVTSSKGWSKTETLNNLGLTAKSKLSGTGIPLTHLDPVWRADGSLASVSLKTGGAIDGEGAYIGGATHSATFNTNGTLATLTAPGITFGGHSISSGVETLTVDGVTHTTKLDGTQHSTSGTDIIGKTDTLAVSGGGFQETIHPAIGSDTSLSYNAAGAPTGKSYAAGAGEAYTSYPGGLLHTVSLARGGELTFGYSDDGAKDLISAAWPTVTSGDFTIPALAEGYGYDRAGRINTLTDSSGVRGLVYQNGRLQQTTWSSGALAGYSVVKTLDQYGRDAGFTLQRGASVIHSAVKVPNDVSGEISEITSGGLKVVLGRNAARQITGFQWGNATGTFVPAVTQNWTRGTAGRIEAANSNVTGAPGFVYLIDGQPDSYSFDLGRRLKCATAGGEWTYQYGTAGQLTSAVHTATLPATSLGSFSYSFDGIGRRTDKGTANTTDLLNRTLGWTHSQDKTLKVTADHAAHVRVNGNDVENFDGEVSFAVTSPGTSGGWVEWNVLAVLEGAGEGNPNNPNYNSHASPDAKAEQTGAVWVPPVSETFGFDAAGNRQSSALWDYGWDGRNKLVRARTKNHDASVRGYDITFDYDSEGRRFKKNVKVYQNGVLVSQNRITFIWDGWDMIYELHQNPSGLTTLERKYVWGPDIADGNAGGAGGLLLIRETRGTQTKDYYPLYDGSGHVIGLADSNGVLVAEYAYGPFGELIHAKGPMAQINPIRYATKYYDSETGLYYIGARYLDPITGQWLSREPLGESESVNLYAYTGNDPINKLDVRGLWQINTQEAANDQRTEWLLMQLSAGSGLPTAPLDEWKLYFPESGDFGLFKPYGADDYKRAQTFVQNLGRTSLRASTWQEAEAAKRPAFAPAPEWIPSTTAALTLGAANTPLNASINSDWLLPTGAGAMGAKFAFGGLKALLPMLATGSRLEGRLAAAEMRAGELLPDFLPNNVARLNYSPTSGAILQGQAGRTTTILGNYRMDMQHIVAEMGNVKSLDFGPKPGGLNVLNVSDELYKTPSQFWIEYNRPWLDQAISRGDDFIFATKPDFSLLRRLQPETGKFGLSGFGREYLHLRRSGMSSLLPN